ncbi:hypothetical protein SAMN05660865_00215 [Caloramator fervidus]|uniref:Uncharacterized protein n=1 Tax=Caloramator fervidus TaxID=29344 RepID=A0A1H5RU47_9CLOT|nr:hypothetical protein [Caloramator fervidus]SEF41869.1 hypothetical protein SAMN05660865_00215 [Caloramator fervidus]
MTTITIPRQAESIIKIQDAEAQILSCLSKLLYTNTSEDDPTPKAPSILFNIYKLLKPENQVIPMTAEIASLIKQLLCAYACKEASIADILKSISCKIAVDNGLVSIDDDCDCCFIKHDC